MINEFVIRKTLSPVRLDTSGIHLLALARTEPTKWKYGHDVTRSIPLQIIALGSNAPGESLVVKYSLWCPGIAQSYNSCQFNLVNLVIVIIQRAFQRSRKKLFSVRKSRSKWLSTNYNQPWGLSISLVYQSSEYTITENKLDIWGLYQIISHWITMDL